MSKINKVKDLCGIPIHSSTNHCFNDRTHHTCCMLGPQARKYADEHGIPMITGNDILESMDMV